MLDNIGAGVVFYGVLCLGILGMWLYDIITKYAKRKAAEDVYADVELEPMSIRVELPKYYAEILKEEKLRLRKALARKGLSTEEVEKAVVEHSEKFLALVPQVYRAATEDKLAS